jgi:hypothetical protein
MWPLKLKHYVMIWFGILCWMSFEYLSLNKVIAAKGIFSAMKVNPDPGRPMSFTLGWLGFSIICLTNLYILRKRLPALRDKGNVTAWLDFHIFCGLLGPTLIVFHSNFQVKGLVSVSFWSMMISFASGVVGRYFYTQLLAQKGELKARLTELNQGFVMLAQVTKPKLTPEILRKAKDDALIYAGGTAAVTSGQADLLTVFFLSVVGDLKLMVSRPPVPKGAPRAISRPLKDYARAKRRLLTGSYYRRFMGYWHTFHMPFAIFMYVVSVIHIASALIFRVNH